MVLPLPTEMLGADSNDRVAYGVYIGSVLVASVALLVLVITIIRTPEIQRAGTEPPTTTPALIAAGLLVVALVVAVTVPGVGMSAIS